MELQPLTLDEAEQLSKLLERAIYNTQFGLGVQILDEDGSETHSGLGSMDCRLTVHCGMCSGEHPVNEDDEDGPWEAYEQAEVNVLIPDETIQYLGGNHPILHRMRANHPDLTKLDRK